MAGAEGLQINMNDNDLNILGDKPVRRSSTSKMEDDAGPLRKYCGYIGNSATFEKAILLVIVCNAAWIGVDVDWNHSDSGIPTWVFFLAENFFCIVFTFELIVRLCMQKSPLHYFKDPKLWRWNWFDFLLVSLMILETWILRDSALNQLTMLRLLRLLRISRIFRMVPELGMMVKSMAAAARSVSSTLVLEIGLMYVFAVIFTQWARDHEEPCFTTVDDHCILSEYFGSIAKSLLSLMQVLVFDDTFALIRPLMHHTWYMGWLLIIFICVGSFTVLNMLIGVICEIVSITTSEEREKMLRERVKEVFTMIDHDMSGHITKEEFHSMGRENLMKLGIDEEVLNGGFDIMDTSGDGHLEVDEFLQMIFKLLHAPQTQDVLKIHQKLDRLADNLGVCLNEPPKGKPHKHQPFMSSAPRVDLLAPAIPDYSHHHSGNSGNGSHMTMPNMPKLHLPHMHHHHQGAQGNANQPGADPLDTLMQMAQPSPKGVPTAAATSMQNSYQQGGAAAVPKLTAIPEGPPPRQLESTGMQATPPMPNGVPALPVPAKPSAPVRSTPSPRPKGSMLGRSESMAPSHPWAR